MKILHFLIAVLLSVSVSSYAQNVGINTDGSKADKSAMLDIKSTAKGMLIPRMTKMQKDSIAMPATGLLVYQTDDSTGFYFNKGTAEMPNWQYISTGAAGAQGPQGIQGEKGEKGDAGTQGVQGIQGEHGPQGIMGMTGMTGETGANGEKGDKGDVGEKGDKGPEGPAGVQGVQGDKGDTGAQGNKGDVGDKGDTGAQGDKGDKGDTGEAGPQGIQGIQGPQGFTGDKGDKGDTGAKGDKGAQGLQGAQGPIGLTGATGMTGMTGETGAQGATGPQGPKGDKGDAGAGLTNGSAAYQVYLTGATAPYAPAPQTLTGNVSIDKFGQTTINSNVITNSMLQASSVTTSKVADNTVTTPKILDGAVTVSKIGATGTANSSTFLRGDGSWTNSTSTPGVANLFSSYHYNYYTDAVSYQSVSYGGSNNVEYSYLLTLIPTACTAKRLTVFNPTTTNVTYTLRIGSSITNMANTALTVTVAAGATGFADANVVIPANSLIDFSSSGGLVNNANYILTALSIQ